MFGWALPNIMLSPRQQANTVCTITAVLTGECATLNNNSPQWIHFRIQQPESLSPAQNADCTLHGK